MIDLIGSPWRGRFTEVVASANTDLFLCSPYVGREPCAEVARLAHAGAAVTLLCDLSRRNLLSGSTDAAAIADLVRSIPQTTVRFLPSLHAKVYVADETIAVVSSSNLTESGMSRNMEYGIGVRDPQLVRQIRLDIQSYGELGTGIALAELAQLATIAADLKEVQRAAERSMQTRLRREFDRRLEQANIEVLRIRAAGRAPHTIFAHAITYLLRQGPMATTELHRRVQAIHPDLCGDSVDRVIDGRSFGKKWKHAVRTAQQYLKKGGIVRYDESRRVWVLSNDGS